MARPETLFLFSFPFFSHSLQDLKKQRHKDLLYALQIRKNFGGMKGDMRCVVCAG